MLDSEKKLYDSQEVENWTLRIPFKSPLIKYAKELGAKWNRDTKVWNVSCKHCELVWNGLDCKIVDTDPEPINGNTLGNFGTGCITTYAKAMKYGYDAIER